MSTQWGKKHFKVAFIHPLLIEKIIIFCSLKKLKCEFNSVMARGSIPSSHARGQRFKPQSWQNLFIQRSLSWFGLASTPAELLPTPYPAFLLSASRPFNWWPSVWFGSMLCDTACDSTDSRVHFRRQSL